MSAIRPKTARLRLDPLSYERLRQRILRRDGWRCQSCGAMSNLEVHHRQFRSHSGNDTEENLITLCAACHANAHRKVPVRKQEGIDPDWPVLP
jgi:5-methylcytosine-specific restriction endonuclease McrA